jgi:NADH-quinone oxidoreductase subunit F
MNKNIITVGMGTCGRAAGAEFIFEELKNSELDYIIKSVGCFGMCYTEPNIVVYKNNQTEIYGNITKENISELINSIKNNNTYKPLLLSNSFNQLDYFKKQKRLILKNCGLIDPFSIDEYIKTGGFNGLKNVIKNPKENIIETLKKARLRGRGGAGASTAMKWSFLAKAQGEKYLICNADEGDPGAFMNRTIMESDPFRLIEGMIIASYAVGSNKGYIYTRAEYPLAIKTLENAINLSKQNNYLGENILGIKDFNFEIEIKVGAGAFVCGEETALMNSIEGKRGMPRPRPPYPATSGLWSKPSNINNVGTFSHVSSIFQDGVDNYIKLGTEKTGGTKVICLTGKFKRTGVVEVPFGITLRELFFDIAGGASDNHTLKAVQSGGPSGGCIAQKHFDLNLDYESINSTGAIMGSGGLVAMDETDCMVSVAKYFLNFTQEESCGKCTPCREGTKRMYEIVDKITKGLATMDDLKNLKDLAYVIRDTALCGLGNTAPNPVLTTIEHFYDEYIAHIENKTCPAKQCSELLTYNITDKCIGCTACARACPKKCISGKPKEKHIIDQHECIKCGSCYDVCPIKAVERK